MKFVQLVEYATSKPDEVDAVMNEWVTATEGTRTAARSITTSEREISSHYVAIVEFPSHEDAMRNSQLPATSAFAEKLGALCDSGPTFRNLDVVREDTLS